jgi:UDP-N-acetylmuramoyl-tripeptide--D-alanyl-D-alanine ligase
VSDTSDLKRLNMPWNVSLAQVCEALSLTLPCSNAHELMFSRVSTDSRDIVPGDLFVALKGERADGHDFVEEVFKKGALAVLVEHETPNLHQYQLKVASCIEALGRLAQWWRSQLSTQVIGVTGSNGKTTVKEMITLILVAQAKYESLDPDISVLATSGNFNNHLGLPLTLLRLRPSHCFAVVEMGMNHAGELTTLSKIAQPNVALVNNVQRAHVGFLGTLQNVAHAKAEIFSGLSEDGLAVINADDPSAEICKEHVGSHRIITFAVDQTADVGPIEARVTINDKQQAAQQLVIRVGSRLIACHLPLPGKHNASNALAAIAATMAIGIDPALACKALEDFKAVKGRLRILAGKEESRIIDDTYNANPDSVLAAISVLSAQVGVRVMVLGDLGELGDQEQVLHAELGKACREAGIEYLFGLGSVVEEATKEFGGYARVTQNPQEVCDWIIPLLSKEVTVLVKGSRFMRMERIVEGLAA